MNSITRSLIEITAATEFRKKMKDTVVDVDTVDTRDTSWMYRLSKLMASKGFERAGSGKYGMVFINKSYDYAIKIFMKDSAYLRWIDFSMKNEHNPYVPKIKGKVIKITDIIYAIRLEKLKPHRSSNGSEFWNAYSLWRNDNSYRSGNNDIDDVLSHFSENKKLLDSHFENVMDRGKQMVVIDPYYNWFNKHKNMDYTIDIDDFPKDVFGNL